MLWWDEQIKEAELQARMRALSFPNLVVYALGCVTHAKEVLLADPPDQLQPDFFRSVEILERVWQEFPRSLERDWMAQAKQEAVAIEPDHDQRVGFMFCEAELMTAISFGMALGAMHESSEKAVRYALGAQDRAYIFIYQYHHELDGSCRQEEEIREVEQSSDACQTELQFQLDFLTAIEQLGDRTLPYSKILDTIK